MADATPGGAPSTNRNLMILLSYLWLLALVPLLTEKDDKELQWHAKHGVLLMVVDVVILTLIGMFVASMGIFGCIAGLFMPLAWLAIAAVHIVCVMKALDGKRFLIPGISEHVEKF
jgi:uncharacterized membrane protein